MIEIQNNRFLKTSPHVNNTWADLVCNSQQHLDQLWIGDIRSANDHNDLYRKNIKNGNLFSTVITIAQGSETIGLQKSNSINYHFIPINDNTETAQIDFYRTSSLIQSTRTKGGVLIHCAKGISRSPSVVIAYTMWKYGWEYIKGYDFVRARRRITSPILSLKKALKGFYNSLHKDRTNQKKPEQLPYVFSLNTKNPKRVTPFYEMKRTVHYKSIVSKIIEPQLNQQKIQQRKVNEQQLFYKTLRSLNNPQSVCRKTLSLSKKWI